MKIETIERIFDDLLAPTRFSDYAVNGIQVDTPATVRKVAFGVTASQECIDAAVQWGADLLVVHHGLIWGPTPFRGHLRRRLKALLTHDTGLMAYHLPLDAHHVLGNSAVLAAELAMTEITPFAHHKGALLGLTGTLNLTRKDLLTRLTTLAGPYLGSLEYGPETIQKVAIVSGDGSFALSEAVLAGCDTFITGEMNGPSQYIAQEEGVNFIALGHERSEQFGVKALAAHCAHELHLETKLFLFDFQA